MQLKTIMLLIVLFSISFVGQASSENARVSRYNSRTRTLAAYPEVTIHDIQYVPPESLRVADSLQNSIPSRWTLQASPYMNDTVVVTALVVVACAPYPPYEGLTFTQQGWTMLLHDTVTSRNKWAGIFLRVGDTVAAKSDGFLLAERGDVIRVTATVMESPTNSMNSVTQLQPVPGWFSIRKVKRMNAASFPL